MAQLRFNPVEFANYAFSLASNTQAEVATRTAVGRLYYACFLTALYHLYPSGTIPSPRWKQQTKARKRPGMHAIVIDDVMGKDSALGTQLDALRALRVQADYRLLPNPGYQNWSSNWQQAYAISQHILPRLPRI